MSWAIKHCIKSSLTHLFQKYSSFSAQWESNTSKKVTRKAYKMDFDTKYSRGHGRIALNQSIHGSTPHDKMSFWKTKKVTSNSHFFGRHLPFLHRSSKQSPATKNTDKNVRFKERIPSKTSHGLRPETATILHSANAKMLNSSNAELLICWYAKIILESR